MLTPASQRPTPLGYGVRIANFARPDQSGTVRLMHGLSTGNPALILLVEQAPSVRELLAGVSPPEDTVLILIAPNQEEASTLEQHLSCAATGEFASVTCLADPDRAVTEYLQADAQLPCALVLDRRLTLFARGQGDGKSLSDALSAAASAPRPAPPVLTVPSLFTPDECARLIRLMAPDEMDPSPSFTLREGQAVMAPDPSQKVRRDLIVPEGPDRAFIMQALTERLVPALQAAFHFRPSSAEDFKLVCYRADEDGHFAVHRDNISPDTSHRKFALTVNLNTPDYDGGGLVFPEYDPTPLAPEAGGAVVFSGSLAHRVMPVIRGTRFALITFFH